MYHKPLTSIYSILRPPPTIGPEQRRELPDKAQSPTSCLLAMQSFRVLRTVWATTLKPRLNSHTRLTGTATVISFWALFITPVNRPLIHDSDAHLETSNKLDKSRSGNGSAISLRMALRRKKASSLGFETIQQNLKVREESACLEVK